MWIKILSLIYKTNLIIEAKNATLDIESKNIQILLIAFGNLKWDDILQSSKVNAANLFINIEYKLCRKLRNFADAENHQKNVFSIIKETILKYLNMRFKFLE